MGTEEYIKIAKQRAGVEGIPSVLTRKYKVASMPVRGYCAQNVVWVQDCSD